MLGPWQSLPSTHPSPSASSHDEHAIGIVHQLPLKHAPPQLSSWTCSLSLVTSSHSKSDLAHL